ncbi:F-box protein SKIP19 [Heracleum sosnowskyi]|uniref:F-box protein SKIP19 n=1 Tax=Heracleum sosnowskyi TaxID=360622 RepID=A0AAD8ISP9_9APIA|nr:F-box protein SKIP19 [Heracleum sosnowskyi]
MKLILTFFGFLFVHKSSQLRRLCLSSCNDITSKGFSEMLKELPMLEELHLEHMHVSKQAIEVAGHCCPRLKSFKLNYDGYRRLYAGLGDHNALPIAENLRGLRHLQLIGNNITIDGLLAIIENCPHLESLDIWNCFNVANQLGSDLRKRLSKQIKDLRLPLCFTKDY